jgi:hypothetical protein
MTPAIVIIFFLSGEYCRFAILKSSGGVGLHFDGLTASRAFKTSDVVRTLGAVKRDARLAVRLSRREKVDLAEVAREQGRTSSDVVRRLVHSYLTVRAEAPQTGEIRVR